MTNWTEKKTRRIMANVIRWYRYRRYWLALLLVQENKARRLGNKVGNLMLKANWLIGIPLDILAAMAVRVSRKWEWYRLPLKLRLAGRLPEYEKMEASKDNETGESKATATIKKTPEMMKVAAAMMTMLREAEGADNYIEITTMASDGEVYSLLVSKMGAKSQATIIDKLKEALLRQQRGLINLVDVGALPHEGWEEQAMEYVKEIDDVLDWVRNG